MNPVLNELNEIPLRANDFLKNSGSFPLPLRVPYLGMGSSYFAPLAFKYMGINIYPELASEYYNCFKGLRKRKHAVIISQSGESSEALWCRELFDEYTAVTNNPGSALGKDPHAVASIPLLAGEELYSSSKTYINTLLALFTGFGLDTESQVAILSGKISFYRELGHKMAEVIYGRITGGKVHGIYVIGTGPNIATAYEAALILSETTKLCFTGMAMAQYDHGPKETAANSIVIQILTKGASRERGLNLNRTISRAGAEVLTVEEPEAEENFSVLHNIIPFNFMAAYLAQMLNITTTFAIGGKVTTASL